MKSFQDFISLKEEMPPAQDLMQSTQMPAQTDQSSDPQEIEHVTRDVQRAIDKLLVVLDKHKINKQVAINILSTIISQIANNSGLTANNVRQAGLQGMRTNSEPTPPPMQPQAI